VPLRLVLRTQPRSVSARFCGGSKMRPPLKGAGQILRFLVSLVY